MADHTLTRITQADFHARLKAQGVAREDIAFVCPVCKTVQSMRSLVRAGAPAETVENAIGFSCEGRFTGVGQWPSSADFSARAAKRRARRGCDWTLGGLFKIHTLEVVMPDGTVHPMFDTASPEAAQALASEMTETVDG